MEINERVQWVMAESGKSKSDLATLLSVSLAQLSHISSGRNKPGLELIQKLIQHFPKISAEWLLSGEGERLKTQGNSEEFEHWLHKTEQKIREIQLELKELELQLKEKRTR